MRAEWFIREQLRQLGQPNGVTVSLIPTERTVSPVGTLKYSANTYNIYVSENMVTVDVPVFFVDGSQVLRAQHEYDKDPVEAILRSCYAILGVFLKTIFLETVESGTDYSAHQDCILTDTIGVLRHFNPWVLDKEGHNRYQKYSSDLLSGFLTSGLQEQATQLSYAVGRDDGKITFYPPGAVEMPAASEGSGWLSLFAAPHQSQLLSVEPKEAVEKLALADYRLLYRAGSGRNVTHWEAATATLAVATLTMLVR